MGDLRTRLLDAAIELVADHGLGGLTHSATDDAAGAAPGAAHGEFPTQRDLVEAVTERCIEREMEMAAPRGQVDASASGIAAMFGHFVGRALGEDRAVTLARYALHAEAARTPSLRPFYAVGADEVDTWAVDLVRRAGSRHPERDVGFMANYVTGLVFHELALPSADLDGAARVRTLIDALDWTTP
jgi:hypothetical protein